ncbi:MAG: short-chain dehydrogenase [Gammaproteobacteria bacterium]|nr:short-chain dehydrogenase [Gammaproteobacteria bacterium]|tara:strand:+ start:112 stop:900 length:789 start_codon:yes stop_codon:yes gene_type:complete
MDLKLKDKVVVITGGSEGIGRAAAERFSQEGALVAIASRTQSDLDTVAAEISAQSGNEVIGVSTDVRNEHSVKALIENIIGHWGRIDVLVNNAGTSSTSTLENLSNEQLDEDINLKVKGAIYCTRHALPHLKESKGCICNTTTPGGKAPTAGTQPTALSRAAGISLTKTWAFEFAADGVRVNTVCVGFLRSRQHRLRWEASTKQKPDLTLDEFYDQFNPRIPMGRVGEAREAGDVIVFLCSAMASYVTGTAINADGGMSPVV